MYSADYDSVCDLKKRNAAWKLLAADSAPLIVSFLNKIFIEQNYRTISEPDLAEKLEDELFAIREVNSDEVFKRAAQDYLKDWASPDKGWLRRFYPEGSDEPHYDMTPDAEKAVMWAISLSSNSFIGTESRLKTIFELLRQMVSGVEMNPAVRIEELQKRRNEIDSQIEAIKRGELAILDDTAVRDRFLQFSSMSRELLGDFREVEQNFRVLDRNVREKIAKWDEGKGELLEEIIGAHDAINDSDQGRSFRAFNEFLTSPEKQEEIEYLVQRVVGMEQVQTINNDENLRRICDRWLDASYHTMDMVRLLSAQLSHFLGSKVRLENKRIAEILHSIEKNAIDVRENPPISDFMELEGTSLFVNLTMERPLFVPSVRSEIESDGILEANDSFNAAALFESVYVDKGLLAERVDRLLRTSSQVTLSDVLAEYPPKRGLAEVLAYMSIAAERGSVFNETSYEELEWVSEDGHFSRVKLPTVIFLRTA